METAQDGYAMDYSGHEGAQLLEDLQQASQPAPTEEVTQETRQPDLDPETIEKGTAQAFEGLTKIISSAVGQDMTPTETEKEEAGRALGPVVQKRMPSVAEYSVEAAATLWLIGYANDKYNWSK